MNNQVTIVGYIASEFIYDHEMYGEIFYRFTLSVIRESGTADYIPVIISERLLDVNNINMGQFIAIRGQFRSYNLHEPARTRLILYVFAQSLEALAYSDNVNDVFLEGYITKLPIYRVTPLGREIADIMLGIERDYNKIDFIPCVCWGRTAKYVSGFRVGDYIRVSGRIQSRNYNKAGVVKTAYEVSVNLLESV